MSFGNMEFTGKLTEEDLSDARKMSRSGTYWLRVLAVNWYGTLLLIAITWGTIAALVDHKRVDWDFVGLMWLVVVGLFVWSYYRVRRSHARAFTKLDAALPDQVILTNDGVKLDGPDGATSFLPWNTFKGFREGQRVILLDRTKVNNPVALPIVRLSENERRSLRDFLRSRISSMSR